jgi:hypothetical protein
MHIPDLKDEINNKNDKEYFVRISRSIFYLGLTFSLLAHLVLRVLGQIRRKTSQKVHIRIDVIILNGSLKKLLEKLKIKEFISTQVCSSICYKTKQTKELFQLQCHQK